MLTDVVEQAREDGFASAYEATLEREPVKQALCSSKASSFESLSDSDTVMATDPDDPDDSRTEGPARVAHSIPKSWFLHEARGSQEASITSNNIVTLHETNKITIAQGRCLIPGNCAYLVTPARLEEFFKRCLV